MTMTKHSCTEVRRGGAGLLGKLQADMHAGAAKSADMVQPPGAFDNMQKGFVYVTTIHFIVDTGCT